MTTWMRFENRPVTKWGIEFRSVLEVNVAEQLDALGIEWAYERQLPGPGNYLPDFTIVGAPDRDFQCPTWIEVKPNGLLYTARDHFDIPEKFTDDVFVEATVSDFVECNPDGELAAVKSCAELYDESALVVYKINALRCLSIEMRPDGAVFSRSHPLVNWQTVLKERAADERRRAYELEMEQRRVEQAAEAHRRALEHAEWTAGFIRYFKNSRQWQAKYPTRCEVCRSTQPAEAMRIVKSKDGTHWIGCCLVHLA